MSSPIKLGRKNLIFQIILFSLGFFYALVFYVKVSDPVDLQAMAQDLFVYLSVVGTSAFAIGIINLSRIHWRNIARKRPNRPFSLLLLASLYTMAGLSLISGPFALDPRGTVIPQTIVAVVRPIWEFAFYKMFVPITSMLIALLAFFIASAAYRAFTVRTLESTIMLAVALVVIIGQAPIGELLWVGFPVLRDWILAFPNAAGQRGIVIGGAVGALGLYFERLIRYAWE